MYHVQSGIQAWKGMLLNQLMQLSPKTGGKWLPSLKCMFLSYVQTPRRNLTSNRFLLGTSKAWDAIKRDKLQPYTPSVNLLQNFVTVLVRVIAKFGKKWLLDPQPSIAHLWDMLWLYARQPVSRLMWTQGYGSEPIPWWIHCRKFRSFSTLWNLAERYSWLRIFQLLQLKSIGISGVFQAFNWRHIGNGFDL